MVAGGPARLLARPPASAVDTGQLARYLLVGLSGYVVNVALFALLSRRAGAPLVPAATGAFLLSVANNYAWNRFWTFRRNRGRPVAQGLRFLSVSVLGYGVALVLLGVCVAAGVDRVEAQLVVVALVTPVNFLGNKLWSFRC